MKRILIFIVIIATCITGFLMYNHKKSPIKEDVFKITQDWSPVTEEIYLVEEIDGEWLTIFRNTHSIMIARLEQNWLGYWRIKDKFGNESTLATSDYPPPQDVEFTWSGSTSEGKISYYFGQILNPSIKKIEVETEKNFLEEALIISSGEIRFYLAESSNRLITPLNIRGFNDKGQLVHSTVK